MEASRLEQYAEFRPAWPAFSVYFLGVVIFIAGPQFNPNTQISPALGDLIASLFLAFILIKRFGSVYRVGASRVTVETVFPSRGVKEAQISQIRRIDLRRGLSQRALGVAHVHLYVEGSEDPFIKLFGVPKPEELKSLLLELGAQDERVLGAWRR